MLRPSLKFMRRDAAGRRAPASGRTRRDGGFTLLEVLIYCLIVGVALTAAVSFSFEFVTSRAKGEAIQETERNAHLAMARLAAEVRQAQGINAGSSVFGSNPGTLSLVAANPADDPIVFSVNGGVLQVQQGAGPVLPLTSSKVQVSEFIVDDLSTANGRSRLLRLRIRTNYLSDLDIYAAESVVETTAQIKKADGFTN